MRRPPDGAGAVRRCAAASPDRPLRVRSVGPETRKNAPAHPLGRLAGVQAAVAARPRPESDRLPCYPPGRLSWRPGPAPSRTTRLVLVGVSEPFMEPNFGPLARAALSAGTACPGAPAPRRRAHAPPPGQSPACRVGGPAIALALGPLATRSRRPAPEFDSGHRG